MLPTVTSSLSAVPAALLGQLEMLTGLSSWASSFLTNPLLAGIGVLAISVPIIIHLLNKRKFKIVDWAAMEFLLDAVLGTYLTFRQKVRRQALRH